jgi:hypothetical protein
LNMGKKKPVQQPPKVRGAMKGKVKLFKRPKEGNAWPFLVDEVAVLKPYTDCVAISITNTDGEEVFLALNGNAKMLLKLENVHDAGYAEVGKSTTKYIQEGMALESMSEVSDLTKVTEIYKAARAKALIRFSSEL